MHRSISETDTPVSDSSDSEVLSWAETRDKQGVPNSIRFEELGLNKRSIQAVVSVVGFEKHNLTENLTEDS